VSAGRVIRRILAAFILAGLAGLLLDSPQARLAWWLATATPPARYVVPVAGVRATALRSSFGAPRDDGRHHQGIDIFAPRGTQVLAAARGVVTSTRPNALGGVVVWVVGAGRRLYYYAHLERLEPQVRLGRVVEAGDPLGLVGTTGNARGGQPHLHFGVYAAGGPLDPYPLLTAGTGT
jgi:peptidoglycan LD-endopeptidase LytH